jgi:predicted transcriptional regulator
MNERNQCAGKYAACHVHPRLQTSDALPPASTRSDKSERRTEQDGGLRRFRCHDRSKAPTRITEDPSLPITTKRSLPAASPVSLKLDEKERSRLSALASARNRSSHFLMREAVREYLTREEIRQSFRDEADKAWRDYEETGLHATQAELDAWATSLGTRRPKRAPKWHK